MSDRLAILTDQQFPQWVPQGTPWLVENSKDGTFLLLVPGGRFLAGGPEEDQGGEVFEVELPPYYLGATAVTNAQYAQFLTERAPGDSDLQDWIFLGNDCYVRSRAGNGYEAYGDRQDHPVIHVTWYGAKAYCQWAGLRLPTELEWDKAARGINGREYPWGNKWDENKCRNNKNSGGERTCSVWSYPEGCSVWGHYQMSGNVWEWCADPRNDKAYDRYKQGDMMPVSDGLSSTVIVRGGSWGYDVRPDAYRCANRSYDSPNAMHTYTGFRVAKTLSP